MNNYKEVGNGLPEQTARQILTTFIGNVAATPVFAFEDYASVFDGGELLVPQAMKSIIQLRGITDSSREGLVSLDAKNGGRKLNATIEPVPYGGMPSIELLQTRRVGLIGPKRMRLFYIQSDDFERTLAIDHGAVGSKSYSVSLLAPNAVKNARDMLAIAETGDFIPDEDALNTYRV